MNSTRIIIPNGSLSLKLCVRSMERIPAIEPKNIGIRVFNKSFIASPEGWPQGQKFWQSEGHEWLTFAISSNSFVQFFYAHDNPFLLP